MHFLLQRFGCFVVVLTEIKMRNEIPVFPEHTMCSNGVDMTTENICGFAVFNEAFAVSLPNKTGCGKSCQIQI